MLFVYTLLAFEKRGMASKPTMTDGDEAWTAVSMNHAVELLQLKVKSLHPSPSALSSLASAT